MFDKKFLDNFLCDKKSQQYLFEPGMPNSRQQNISEQSDHPELQFDSIKNEASNEESQRPNIMDQAFILYSDDEFQSNSQSFTERDSHSDLSNLSRQSSCSSIDNYDLNNQSQKNPFLLKSLSHANQESSVYNIHESQCSQSGIQLLHALQPLFKGKVFLRRSPRFSLCQPIDIKVQNKNQILPNKNQKQETNKKQIDCQMIDDDKPTQMQKNLSSRIIQQKYDAPTSIFTNSMLQNNLPLLQTKQQASNPFIRFTRSSKKDIQEQNQLSFANVSKNPSLNIFNNNCKQHISDNQYVSRITKDFLLINRKQKRIKKQQQKQVHNSYSLKGFRRKQNSFQYPSN